MISFGLRLAVVVCVLLAAEAAQAQFVRPIGGATGTAMPPVPINHGSTQSLTPLGGNLKADLTPSLQTPTATPTVNLPAAAEAASTQVYEATPAYEPERAYDPAPEAVVASIPESDDASEVAAYRAIAAGGSPPPSVEASSEDGGGEEDDEEEDEEEKDDREAGPLMRAWAKWISWPLWAQAIS